MRQSVWGYVIAIAIGGVSLVVKEVFPDATRLRSGLLLLAFVIALLATLYFAHDQGWFGGMAAMLRRARLRTPRVSIEGKPYEDGSRRPAGPHVQAPRQAGPAGPVPVLQKRPKDATNNTVVPSGVPAVGSPKKPSDE